jgi:hypothetical protein
MAHAESTFPGGIAAPGRNEFINGDFRQNVRGLPAQVAVPPGQRVYVADAWSAHGAAAEGLTITAERTGGGGIELSMPSPGTAVMMYMAEDDGIYRGVPLSVTVSADGAVRSLTGVLGPGQAFLYDAAAGALAVAGWPGVVFIAVMAHGTRMRLDWAKLEFGRAPTPYAPPDAAVDALRYARRFQVVSAHVRAPVMTPEAFAAPVGHPLMRAAPAVAFLDRGIFGTDGAAADGFTWEAWPGVSHVYVQASKPGGHGLSDGTIYAVLALDADL